MKKTILIFAILNYALFALGQNYNYDQNYIRLTFYLDPEVKYVKAKEDFYFKPLDEPLTRISIGLTDSLKIDSILYHGQKLTFVHEGSVINVNFALQIDGLDSLTIFYQGVPSGDYSFEVSYVDNVPVMWTLSEPYGAIDWFAVKQQLGDKIDSLDLLFYIPQEYYVASNGVIVEDFVSGNTRLVHWRTRYPTTPYLVAFAVTDYKVYYDYANIGDTLVVPIQNFVYPDSYDYAKEVTPAVAKVLEFYSSLVGVYPFWKEKYGQAQFEWGGGMEHQTITFLGSFSHSLMAHELAHQWFGDFITCASWHEIYLNEAFATYFEGLTAEAGLAPYSWEEWKANKISAVLSMAERGSVYVEDTTDVWRIFSMPLTYYKGALFLHQLRWTIGDDAFFSAIKSYANDPALRNGFATTQDLKRHLEQKCSCNLDYMFEQWLYGSGYPVYDITWKQDSDGTFVVETKQETTDPASVSLFKQKVPLLLHTSGADTTVIIQVESNEQTNTFYVKDKVFDVVFDPEKWLLAYAVVNNQAGDVVVMPTITRSSVKVKFSQIVADGSWEIFNLSGRRVLSGDVNGTDSITIDLSSLSPSAYVLVLKLSDNQTVSRKIIKL